MQLFLKCLFDKEYHFLTRRNEAAAARVNYWFSSHCYQQLQHYCHGHDRT